MLDCGFAEFLYRALFLFFGAKCLPQIEGGEGGGRVMSSWMWCCCPDTGLSSGMHFG